LQRTHWPQIHGKRHRQHLSCIHPQLNLSIYGWVLSKIGIIGDHGEVYSLLLSTLP
jgi:hypothetical protein